MLRERRDAVKENELIPLQLLEQDVKKAQKKREIQKR